jgi:hypothetical protein
MNTLSTKPPVGEFRPGPAGTSEALPYEFSNEHSNLDTGLDAEKTIAMTHRVAAISMLHAVEWQSTNRNFISSPFEELESSCCCSGRYTTDLLGNKELHDPKFRPADELNRPN